MIFSALKDPENIEDIGHSVGDDKGDAVADYRVAGPSRVVYRSDGHFEKSHGRVFGLQCRKYPPGNKVKDKYMRAGGNYPCDNILEELQECRCVNMH